MAMKNLTIGILKVLGAERVAKRRAGELVAFFENFIQKGERVLDIGGGGGWVAQALKARTGADVTILDTRNFNQTGVNCVIYDGDAMPFEDDSFYSAIIVFTLHHCQNPIKVLAEAKRVARGKIIIIEDITTSLLNKILLSFWDIISGLISVIAPPGEDFYFKFYRDGEWQKIFQGLGLKIIFQKQFQSNKTIRHKLFVLQK